MTNLRNDIIRKRTRIVAYVLISTLSVIGVLAGVKGLENDNKRFQEGQIAIAEECRMLGGLPIWYGHRVERCERGCK